jgi:hypothetical protein
MKVQLTSSVTAIVLLLTACGGGGGSGSEATKPSDHHSQVLASYNGNSYYAAATGQPDSFLLSNLPNNKANEIIWNSIARNYDTGSGAWEVVMEKPNHYPNLGHYVPMAPLSGTWTTMPTHRFQYRVTQVNWNTGLTANANPINSNVPYDIFQPNSPTDWIPMPPDSTVTVCSVSTNSVYTSYLGGGMISCAFEVMDMDTAVVLSSTVELSVNSEMPPSGS